MSGSKLTTKTRRCVTCKTEFVLPRAGKSPHLCPACRIKERAVYDAKRYQELKEGVWQRIADPAEVALTFDQFAEAVIKDERRLPISQDRQPVGYLTPAGSDEGRSTFFKDLAADLDYACKQVAKHEWWEENVHWSYQLDNPLAVSKIKKDSMSDTA